MSNGTSMEKAFSQSLGLGFLFFWFIFLSACGSGGGQGQGVGASLSSSSKSSSSQPISNSQSSLNSTNSSSFSSENELASFFDQYSLLNDTGVTMCNSSDQFNVDCPQENFPGQDSEFGRDAQASLGLLEKKGEGRAGFDFTKVDAFGNDLAATADQWSCVRDNNTGLLWEVKSSESDLHFMGDTYVWFDPKVNTYLHDPAYLCFGLKSGNIDTYCNTNAYVRRVNSNSFCGVNDWRLPSVNELHGIMDYSAEKFPYIDTEFFPNTVDSGAYSTSTTYVDTSYKKVYFVKSNLESNLNITLGNSSIRSDSKTRNYVRLVSDLKKKVDASLENRLEILEDGTVLDKFSNLVWPRCAFGQEIEGNSCAGTARKLTWSESLLFIPASKFIGRDDWRLPNVKELTSLMDLYCQNSPAATTYFPDMPTNWIWSSTPATRYSGAYAFARGNGCSHTNNMQWTLSTPLGVILVRDWK